MVKNRFTSDRHGLLTTVLTLIALLASLVAPARAQTVPDVLNLAPDDSAIMVLIPSIGQTSKKISDFVAAMGLKDLAEDMADPLAKIKGELGIQGGIDEKGSVLVVLGNVKKAIQEESEPDLAILLPITDYKAFTANFEAKEDGGVTSLTSKNSNEEVFARNLGKHAVISNVKAVVADFKPGNGAAKLGASAGKLGSRYLGGSDVAIYVDVKALSPVLRPKLKEMYNEARSQIDNFAGGEGPEAQMAALGGGFLRMYFDSIDALMRDTDSAILGLDVDSKGVGMTMTAQFAKGTYVEKMFGSAKGNAAGTLSKLPSEPYLMSFAMDFAGIDIKGLMNEVTSRLPKEGGFLGEAMKQSVTAMSKAEAMASTYYVPQAAAGIFGGMSGVTVFQTADAAGYIKANKEMMIGMGKMKFDLGADPDGKPMSISYTTKYQDKVVEIDGVTVDQYMVKTNFPPAMLQQMGPMGGLFMNFTTTSGYIGTVGKNVIMTTQPDAELMKKAIAATKAGKGMGDEPVLSQVRKQGLPPNPAMEGYLSVGGLVQALGPIIAMVGGPAIEVPNNLPPVAMGTSFDSGGMAARVYAPMPLIQWIKDTAMNLQNQGAEPGQPRPKGNRPPPAPF